MDNTLIDSDKAHIISYNKSFKKHNLRKVPEKELRKYFGLVGFEIIKKLFPEIKKEKLMKVLNDSHNFFLYDTSKHLKAFKGTKETLKKLRKKYKIVLMSNSRKKEILLSLKKTKINKKMFDLLVGIDSVKRPKPSPDEILYAEKKLNQKVKYVIGDSIYDIKAGKKAKVKTIAVLTGNHTREQLRKEKPDYVLSNFNQVLRIL